MIREPQPHRTGVPWLNTLSLNTRQLSTTALASPYVVGREKQQDCRGSEKALKKSPELKQKSGPQLGLLKEEKGLYFLSLPGQGAVGRPF